ncbi:hypothetical protein MAR_021617 [Mya arenaria]|uniref:Uncharacterized protein n=1 Tax=Mya arenaria TaxID=6604 RepID=A0ABY7EC16_MYAAR|nr:hypothetical protein MAR_021617 [Mya arenaria]
MVKFATYRPRGLIYIFHALAKDKDYNHTFVNKDLMRERSRRLFFAREQIVSIYMYFDRDTKDQQLTYCTLNIVRGTKKGSYFFTLINAKDVYNNTDFYAECAYNPSMKSQIIELDLEVPQNSVVVGPQYGDFFKTKCVYADAGIDIFCKTDTEIDPVSVSFSVGGKVLPLLADGKEPELRKLDNTRLRLKKEMAGSNLTCKVVYSANKAPVEFTAHLCYLEFGTGPALIEPSCFYGDDSTATCEMHNIRPVQKIEIRVNDRILKVQQQDEYDRSKNTFSSKATLKTASKEWNGTEMCCTSRIGNSNIGRSICKPILMSCMPTNEQSSLFVSFWLPIIAVYQTSARDKTRSNMNKHEPVYSTIDDPIDTAIGSTMTFSRQMSASAQSTDYMTPISRKATSGPIRLTNLKKVDSVQMTSHILPKSLYKI